MKHFTIAELTASETARKLGLENNPSSEAVACMEQLVHNVLDPLRDAWKHPIVVTSGYRCRQLNRIVGGVPDSQHILGQAADITVGNIVDNRRLFQLAIDLKLPFDQLILEQGGVWIHVSYGPRQRRQVLVR